MTDPTDAMYDTVLIPTDGSEHAARAAEHGVLLARAFGATVHVVAVVDTRTAKEVAGDDVRLRERLEREAREAVDDVVAMAPRVGLETAVLSGEPSTAILDYADREGADLLAMGTHGRTGINRYIAGSVTERVLRRSTAPVLTVRPVVGAPDEEYEEVLVPTDGSDQAAAAVAHGVAVAERFDARVHAVTVLEAGGGVLAPSFTTPTEVMEQLESTGTAAVNTVADRARAAGLTAVTAVREGLAVRELLAYAEEKGIDLIAMGTAGRTGIDRYLLGSTTERVVRHAEVPVLAVNARERREK